jgi:hypothetical protein
VCLAGTVNVATAALCAVRLACATCMLLSAQYHYPAIAPIVMKTCKEFNVPYRVVPSFFEAFSLHLQHLRDMGKAGKAAHLD